MLDNVYKSEARFLQHLQTQKNNVAQYKTETGATDDDIAEITADADLMEWLIETCNLIDEFKTTAFGIKARFFSYKTEPPAGNFMTAPPIIPPSDVNAGAVKRSRERDQRFIRAVGITEAAKIAMDLNGEAPPNISPENVKPEIQAYSASGAYEFALVVTNRQKADMYDVLVQRKSSGKWEVVKSGTGKSVNVTITPTEEDKPEQILVRVQLKKGNENYGMPSDPIYVTVNP